MQIVEKTKRPAWRSPVFAGWRLLILVQLAADAVRWCGLVLRSQRSIEAENLFLRRQLALYVERGIEPRRIDSVTRVALAFLSRFFHWRDALVVVRPETIPRWRRVTCFFRSPFTS